MITEVIAGGLVIGGMVAVGQIILEIKNKQNEKKLKKIPVEKKPVK